MNKDTLDKFWSTLETQTSGAYNSKIGELSTDSFSTIKKIIAHTNPKTIYEMGFNRGSSSAMWVASSPSSHIISTDRWLVEHQKNNSNKIKQLMSNLGQGGSFQLFDMDHNNVTLNKGEEWYNKFDLIFIDGDHTKNGVERDTQTALKLNPKYIAYDDWFHLKHQKDVRRSAYGSGLVLIEEFRTDCGQAVLSNPNYKNE